MAPSLSSTLEAVAKSNVAKELLANLDKAVATAQADVDKAQAALNEALSVREAIKKALGPVERGVRFYLGSRTGGPGHFIEAFGLTEAGWSFGSQKFKVDRANLRLTCSCEAGRFGRSCWAARHIEGNLRKITPDASWRYTGTDAEFDARVVKNPRQGPVNLLKYDY